MHAITNECFEAGKRNRGTGQSRGARVLGPGQASQASPRSTGKWAIKPYRIPRGQAGFEFVTSTWDKPVHLHLSTRDPVAIAEDASQRERSRCSIFLNWTKSFRSLILLPAGSPFSQAVNQSISHLAKFSHGYCPQLERGPLVLLLIRLSRLFRHEDPPPNGPGPV